VARINQDLLNKIMHKLNVGKARVYAIITETVSRTKLPANIAAIVVAVDAGISVSRFASDEDWELIRSVERRLPSPVAVSNSSATLATPPRVSRKGRKTIGRTKNPSGNKVWIVYGRNDSIRKSLFEFLHSLGLQPIEWNSALAATRKGSPHIAEVLEAGFSKAIATVILFTPDDEAKLKDEFIKRNDLRFERKLTGQPRPNVLFEAGMAFGRHPEKTIIVQVGKIRPISDLSGRHITHLSDSFESRHQLIGKLRTAGCPVDDTGDDWHTAGNFNTKHLRAVKM
jgi:predicted nucleotide-binding protein